MERVGSSLETHTPHKIKIFGWKLLHQKLPTKDKLIKMGLHTQAHCSLCNEEEENSTHLFYKCRFINLVWKHHETYINCHLFKRNIGEDCKWILENDNDAQDRKLLILVTFWQVWKARNERIFKKEEATPRVSRLALADYQDIKCVEERGATKQQVGKARSRKHRDQHWWSLGCKNWRCWHRLCNQGQHRESAASGSSLPNL